MLKTDKKYRFSYRDGEQLPKTFHRLNHSAGFRAGVWVLAADALARTEHARGLAVEIHYLI